MGEGGREGGNRVSGVTLIQRKKLVKKAAGRKEGRSKGGKISLERDRGAKDVCEIDRRGWRVTSFMRVSLWMNHIFSHHL